jgi:hypothetical protein
VGRAAGTVGRADRIVGRADSTVGRAAGTAGRAGGTVGRAAGREGRAAVCTQLDINSFFKTPRTGIVERFAKISVDETANQRVSANF